MTHGAQTWPPPLTRAVKAADELLAAADFLPEAIASAGRLPLPQWVALEANLTPDESAPPSNWCFSELTL